MAGSLLVSGNPQHYKAIGEGGQPVYSVAFQLREAIRLKAGATTANCLAIPQSNQHGSMVDWYAPIAGDVVPWSAATSEERESALIKLDAAHRALERAIAQMTQMQARDSQADREKNTVLPLMSKVFHFPDTNFIYLVNGEPVIAFWGFHAEGSTLPADPFTHLRSVASLSPAATTPKVASNKRAWWWLLLLLLLLLLLFFLLRACAPSVLPVSVQPTPSATPDGRSVTPVTPSAPLIPGAPVTPLSNAKPDGVLDRGTSLLRRWWSGSDTGTLSGSEAVSGNTVVDKTETPTAATTETPSSATTGTPTGESPELPADGAGQTAGQGPGQVPGQNPAEVATPPSNTPPINPSASSQTTPPVTPPAGDVRNPSGQSSAAQGPPLTIPPQAINSGNTGFLDGSWTAGAGIQDAKTGKPLRMEYDFSQGNGQGKVTIKRADGSQCVGSVSAQMQSKNLQISDRGVAKCSDGGTIALPKVTCTPQADGRADCQGRYENGTTFPVSMRHSPK
jgi:hypothetical protein